MSDNFHKMSSWEKGRALLRWLLLMQWVKLNLDLPEHIAPSLDMLNEYCREALRGLLLEKLPRDDAKSDFNDLPF